MADFIRSKEMHLYKILMSSETESACHQVSKLGDLASAHFLNVNYGESPINLKHASSVRRCA